MTSRDHAHMARALRLAAKGRYTTHPNPRVGCVIVDPRGNVVGEGWHAFAGGPHAEVNALAQAGERARGATVYVTLEPCSHHGRTPPCAEALIRAGVARVVAAMADPNPQVAGQGLARLRAAGIDVTGEVMADEARRLNPGFIARMSRGRPFVRSKIAASVDGRTAMAGGESQWITSTDARRDVQRLRAESSAILTGIGTVLADDPALTVRPGELPAADPWPEGIDPRQPLRVVADSRLRLTKAARLLSLPGRVLVATAAEADHAKLRDQGAAVEYLPGADGRVDLRALMNRLAVLGVNELLVEAGATLNGALIQAGLIDEWVIYLAPKVLGDGARGMFHLPGLERMDQAVQLTFADVRAVGCDLRVTVRPSGPSSSSATETE